MFVYLSILHSWDYLESGLILVSSSQILGQGVPWMCQISRTETIQRLNIKKGDSMPSLCLVGAQATSDHHNGSDAFGRLTWLKNTLGNQMGFVFTNLHLKSWSLPACCGFGWLCFLHLPPPPLPGPLPSPSHILASSCLSCRTCVLGRCPLVCFCSLPTLAAPSPRPDQQHLQAETTSCWFWNLLCLAHAPWHL